MKGICSCTIITTPSTHNSMYLVCLGYGTRRVSQAAVCHQDTDICSLLSTALYPNLLLGQLCTVGHVTPGTEQRLKSDSR